VIKVTSCQVDPTEY